MSGVTATSDIVLSEERESTMTGFTGEVCFEEDNKDTVFGYFVYIGRTSCRVFEIDKDGNQLHHLNKIQIQYDDLDVFRSPEEYLENLTEVIRENVSGLLTNDTKFLKTYADPNFSICFDSPKEQSVFWYEFYEKTGLCFNILNYEQVTKNLTRTFSALSDGDVVMNIGRGYVDVYIKAENDFHVKNLNIGFRSVEEYIELQEYGEFWSEEIIKDIKTFIKKTVKDEIDFEASNAYILKDETTFMDRVGYGLLSDNFGEKYIQMSKYKSCNQRKLYKKDFLNFWKENYPKDNDNQLKYWHGFKIGHIILESLFEMMGVKRIYPSNYHCIHGDVNAYVFNIVVGGSYKNGNMEKAIQLLKKMGANITSPVMVNNKLKEPNIETDIEHATEIEGCDLLFVSNDNTDAYFGPTTAMQIYAARLLHKPIAYWKAPSSSKLEEFRLKFIPYECWESKMEILKEDDN